jgi:HEAT repeat protein
MEVDRHNMTARPTVSWEMLEKSLAHSNTLIREKAIETAGRFDDPRALMALQVAVRDSDPRIRAAAAQAFVVAASRRSIAIDSALSQLITSASDDELRSFLIQNALTSGSEILLRAVIACLVDSAPAIRDAAEKVLNERGGSWQVSQAAADTVPVIEGARTAFNAQVGAAAARWCEQLQRAQMRRTMLDSGLATVLTLTGALRSASPLMRAAAAEGLRRAGDARALPALVETLNDTYEDVRRTAAVALGDLKWQPLTEGELARWCVAMSRWDAAVECGSVSLEPLLHAAEHSSAPTRAQALEAVAQLRNVRSIPSVVVFLQSPDAEVRRAAANALKVLEWVPANNEQAIGHAIELEDWSAAIAFGAEAVRPLMAALKDCHDQSERNAAITSAMKQFVDPGTAQELLPFCRDGEVSAAAVSALHSLIERRASELSVDALKGLADLKNVMQFKFAVDPQFARPVRSGMEFVSTDALRAAARAELAQRQNSDSIEGSIAKGKEAA